MGDSIEISQSSSIEIRDGLEPRNYSLLEPSAEYQHMREALCRFLSSSVSKSLEALLGLKPGTTSREEVKALYLSAALKLHPDHNRTDVKAAEKMAELQEAWQRYRQRLRHLPDGECDGPGFTEFGVGCSFDDSDVERDARMALMDQAARGVMNQAQISTTERIGAETRRSEPASTRRADES